MREILYRFWIPGLEKMTRGYNLREISEGHAPVFYNIPMQYTGIKDKEDKEIYEGDVVQTPKGRAEVIYNLGCFYVKTVSNYRLGGWNKGVISVIGNIYENHELRQYQILVSPKNTKTAKQDILYNIEDKANEEFKNVGDDGLFPNHTDKDIWVAGFKGGVSWYSEQKV